MLSDLQYLNAPETIIVIVIVFFVISNLIGELLEFKGKVVPEFAKVRKYFKRKRKERKAISEMVELYNKEFKDIPNTLKEVKTLLSNVDQHYNADNITKRNDWMKWVNNQATVYDNTIVEISKKLDNAVKALQENTKMTEEMFVQNSRDRIIDFATKVSDVNAMVSREEFNRIFKVYHKYETFLKERNLTNGEVDVAMRIIDDAYGQHMKNHTFVEDVRGY